MSNIVTIWKKELKDAIRDKRTLMAMIVMPMLLMPIIIIGMGKLTEMQIKQVQDETAKIGVASENTSIDLVKYINEQEKLEVVEITGDLREAIKSKEVDAGIVIPEDFQESIDIYLPVQLELVKYSVNDRSEQAVGRVSVALSMYNQQVINTRLVAEDVDPKILSVITITQEEVATDQEIGGFGLGFILPLFIVMWSIVGGQYIATDISAGEKERKTLESLLLTPAKRLEIVFGKFFAVSTSALISVVISLTSMYFAIKSFGLFGMEDSDSGMNTFGFIADFTIEPQAILIMLAVSVLMVLMFSAVILSIAIFAKSYKEAQSYIGPSYLIVILPVTIINTIPGFEPALWFFSLPAVNSVLLFKEILIGTYDWSHIGLSMISLAIFSVIAIFIASKIYQKEGVLFKD
ncbi:ABC transporter permease [Patescibacteria group bacterium]|nr:ABC transporter permease [Patescibacteria group bacterium]MBU1890831.1 ABC transporter permease [Patescibacteria group bacterium]